MHTTEKKKPVKSTAAGERMSRSNSRKNNQIFYLNDSYINRDADRTFHNEGFIHEDMNMSKQIIDRFGGGD